MTSSPWASSQRARATTAAASQHSMLAWVGLALQMSTLPLTRAQAATATATRTALMHKDHFIGSSGSWLNKFPSTVQGCVDLCPDSKYITYAVYTDKNCRCLGKSSSGFKYNCATYEIKSIADATLSPLGTSDPLAEARAEARALSFQAPGSNGRPVASVVDEEAFTQGLRQASGKVPVFYQSPGAGLSEILGEYDSERLLKECWERSWRLFHTSNKRDRMFAQIWSVEAFEFLVEAASATKEPLRFKPYGDDIALVSQGKRWYPGVDDPVTWAELHNALALGATIMMSDVVKRHGALYRLCARLAEDLNAQVSVDSYVTPPGKVGYLPHFDTHDTMIMQTEGRKIWWVCNRHDIDREKIRKFREEKDKDRNRTPPWQFKMGSIETGDCSRVVLVPGDVLYLPQGTIHHAEAVRENLSVHLSLTVGRFQTTWGHLFLGLARAARQPQHLAAISVEVAKSAVANRQIPNLGKFRRSVDNEDMQAGFLERWRRTGENVISTLDQDNSRSPVRSFLMIQMADKRAWETALRGLRSHLVLKAARPGRACLGAVGFDVTSVVGQHRFRRVPTSAVMLLPPTPRLARESLGGQLGLAGNKLVELRSSAVRDGVRFALGAFDSQTSRGQGFTVQELAARLEEVPGLRSRTGLQAAVRLVRTLIKVCAIEPLQKAVTRPHVENTYLGYGGASSPEPSHAAHSVGGPGADDHHNNNQNYNSPGGGHNNRRRPLLGRRDS